MTNSQDLVLHDGRHVPAAPDLRKQLHLGLDAMITEGRAGRTVAAPEDTYPLQRRLAAVEETAKDYGRAFSEFARDVRAVVEEELADAVGEQDGIPMSGLTVPDTDGTDLKITLDARNEYDVDRDALFPALAYAVLSEQSDAISAMFRAEFTGDGDTAQAALVGLLTYAMGRAVNHGRFEPRVSKVRATAKELARQPGGDVLAGTVTDAIRKTVLYRGVRVERTQPK
jgi:hypothetical protein